MFYIELRTADGGTRVQVPTVEPWFSVDGKMYIWAQAAGANGADELAAIRRGRLGWETYSYARAAGQRCWIGAPNDPLAAGEWGVFQVGGLRDRSVLPAALNLNGGNRAIAVATSGAAPFVRSNSFESRLVFAIKHSEESQNQNSATQNNLVYCGRMIYT